MKRLFFIFSFVCFTLVPALAQIGEHRSELALGFNGGYMMSQLGFMPEVPQKWHKGLTGGLTLRYTCEKYFSSVCAIVGEVNYAQIGWEEDILTLQDEPVINAETGLPEEYQRDQTYLQIPIFARLGWGRERRGFQFFFQKTKMNFDFDKRTGSYSDGTGRTSSVVAQDTMAVENRLDYGITAGMGLEFSHPKIGHFMLEGRYYYGLGDIYGNSKRDYFGRSNFSNITIKLTYLFDLKKTSNPKIK